MEALIPNKHFYNKNGKKIEITSNIGNQFIVNFKYNSIILFISSLFDNGITQEFFESEYSLEKIKQNKAFAFYETIEEIISEWFPLIDEGKIHLIEEEKDAIKIIFDLPFKKFNNIEFIINSKKENDLKKNANDLNNIISSQNKEINELKNKITIMENTYNNEILELKNKMNILENKYNNDILDLNKKISNLNKDKNNLEEKIIVLHSNIIENFGQIDFILSRFKTRNKKISLNLLFKATRDGQKSTDFHRYCDGKTHQLVFVKTKKGAIFGGYTKEGFNSREEQFIDREAFAFSVSKKKIYNIKQNKEAIYDYRSHGPCFYGSGCHMIYIPGNMFEEKSNTCSISNSHYEGITSNYELNDGKQYFHIQEIEVYQVLFN